MGDPLWKVDTLTNGNFLSTVNYWKFLGGNKFIGINGEENTIPTNLLSRDFWSADHYDQIV